ncbi:hypothetical protein L3Q82_011975 [Scortum barcoo]|uniref:Uncharacterized protein n=1 Tax=Scortum barcoo TaxID=214431 RepID=A0ACB8W6C4_9TELE|nr:hypothetical protein L3Q82_011975 [Scortum barcoo]
MGERLPLPGTGIAAIMTDTSAISREYFKTECHSCPVLTKLHAQIPKTWPGKKADVDPDLQPYYMMGDELSIVEDCIVRENPSYNHWGQPIMSTPRKANEKQNSRFWMSFVLQ